MIDSGLDPVAVAGELVGFESTSCLSNVPVSDYVEQVLRDLGFAIERVEYRDRNGVPKANVIGKRGEGRGGFAYFGHTDVVPAASWSAEPGPFQADRRDGRLYGRGSCDMKGSVACMLAAASRVAGEALQRPLYITCTADEEIGYGGARAVADRSRLFREMVDGEARGVVGEPTRLEVVYAHKGTYGFTATARGEAAHSSSASGYNANLDMIPFLVEMKAIYDQTERDPQWQDKEFDPPTISWNIGVNDHTAAVNIKAPQSVCTVYFRPMPGQKPELLMERAAEAARRNGLEFEPYVGADPLRVDPQSDYVSELLELAGRPRPATVCYGTDGGVLRELKHLAVLGPGDIAQAHTSDEWIALEQLQQGADLYERLIRHWCCP